jgi:energy-coupling factor transporter ATP-binding protein EcfA2
MLKISVTTIESFRNYLNGSLEEEALLKRIRGKYEPSRYMELGTAFHDILEKINERYSEEKKCFIAKNGIEFDYDIIAQCYQAVNQKASFEIKTTKVFTIGNEQVEVVAKVDQLFGNYVYENKTCWGGFSFERYFQSCQWKYYMDIFEAEKVSYNVFCFYDAKNGIQLRGIEQFSFDRYPDLDSDLNELLTSFLEFIHSRKLEEYFQNKPKNNKPGDSDMNIQKIKISNLLGIEDIEFSPGNFTLIEGKNGTGKTSILESIKHALKGGHDAKLLRNGTDKGEIVLVLDDGVHLSKTVTASKSNIKLHDAEGKSISKPQGYIDKLIDMISVNPVQFLSADKKNRVNYLLEAIPMKITTENLEQYLNGMSGKVNADLSEHALEAISKIQKQFYDERTGVNRALKEKLSTMTQLQGSVTTADITPSSISDRLKELENKKGDMESKRSLFLDKATNFKIACLDEEAERFETEINKLRNEHDEIKQGIHEQFEKQKEEIQSKFDEKYIPLVDEISGLKEKQKEISSQEKTREILQQFEDECKQLKEESEKLSQAIGNLDNMKSDLMKVLPIKGLEIKDGEIYSKEVVFDKLNTAEQVKLAVEVAKLRAGDLGIICVDGIEKLDQDTFNEFKSKAMESGLQMIVTKVGDSELKIETEKVA